MNKVVQREERVVLGTDIQWMQPVVEAQGIKQLYAEFVHIDVAVLEVTSCTPELDGLHAILCHTGLSSTNGLLSL